jgi:hypothetical protein
MPQEGADIVGAVMTVARGGLVFFVQVWKLLPHDAMLP